MSYIQILTTSWLLGFITISAANPVVVDETVKKVKESCVVAIGESVAYVSCSVTYRKIKPVEGMLYMIVPVFIAGSDDPSSKTVHSAIKMRLECEGSDTLLRGIQPPALSDIFSPDGGEAEKFPKKKELYFHFGFKPPNQEEFTVVATYSQPLIEDAMYYRPLFEYGESEGDQKDFAVTFFPVGDHDLTLDSAHKGRQMVMNSRVTVIPSHNKIIVVRTKKKKNNENKEMATPRKPSD